MKSDHLFSNEKVCFFPYNQGYANPIHQTVTGSDTDLITVRRFGIGKK